jgi:hypothetical protein
VEEAAKHPSIQSAGSIRSISSATKDMTAYSEDDIPYYKLHGSIDLANTDEGRLILTKKDYNYYELHRKALFKRLENDLSNRVFVFVGYSLNDINFRKVLDDCRSELSTQALPLSYAIKPNFTEIDEQFWREKYNIQLIKADGAEFLNLLKETWIAQKTYSHSF